LQGLLGLGGIVVFRKQYFSNARAWSEFRGAVIFPFVTDKYRRGDRMEITLRVLESQVGRNDDYNGK
jgi:hypothetical protein